MKLLTIILSVFLAIGLQAQVTYTTVTDLDDAQDAVNSVLLGEGVVVSDIQFTGSFEQICSFSNLDSVGIGSGIILSTEIASGLIDNAFTDMTLQFPANQSDADLELVASEAATILGLPNIGNPSYDAVALEFDFTPLGDNVSFNFIFSSAEYPEWVNSPFNDAFGFFVSGPNITGPYSNNAVNIAIVPGSNPELPITISSINDLMNAQFYVSNMNHDHINTDGYTIPLTASLSNLIAGETYHIKLAVADLADSILPTSVILEAGSFTSSIPVDGSNGADFNGDGILNVADLMILMGDFGCLDSCIADINGDGFVTVIDVQLFIAAFN